MTNTGGMLELKITRLEDRLKLLKKQQALSRSYPVHLVHLEQQMARIREQLAQLRRERAELLTHPVLYRFEVKADELYQR